MNISAEERGNNSRLASMSPEERDREFAIASLRDVYAQRNEGRKNPYKGCPSYQSLSEARKKEVDEFVFQFRKEVEDVAPG